MPKCPFCSSSQSNGERLTEHMYTKHRDQEHSFERTVPIQKRKTGVEKLRYIVVDGNNVAYHNKNTPSARNIKIARLFLRKNGFEPIIIISSALRHKVDDKLELIRMINMLWVIEADPHTNDDKMIIEKAINKKCNIVTNDRFLDHMNEYTEFDFGLKLVKFSIVEGKFIIR